MKFQEVARIALEASTNALALSPDGRLVAVTTFDQKMRLFDAATGALHKALHLGTAFPHSANFSPDGRWAVSGAKSLTFFDTATGKKGVSIKGHRHEVQDATFSPDGTTFYTGSGNGYTPADWSLRAWDAASGAERWRWKAAREVYAVAASPDGRTVAAGDANGIVSLHDADTGAVRWSVATGHWVYCLRFTPDGASLVASGDAPGLRVLRAGDGQMRDIPSDAGGRDFAITPDGARVIHGCTAYGDAVPLRVFDLATGARLAEGPALGRLPQGVALSPDGSRLYVLMNDPHAVVVLAVS
ncbi:MAG: PQQ-binding-like beta-propeller repeat protein [Polyangiales bacterium]